MSSITWLHISDLHWRESEAYDANVVAGALLRDLAERTERIAPELGRIDFIFVTGDIAFASKPEEYVLAQRFFDELRRVTGVRKDRLFIVPGNHDVDRETISDEARDMVAELNGQGAVNRLLGNDIQRAIVMQRFHRYEWFLNNYMGRYLPFSSGRYFYKRERRLADKRIAILGLNSAWASASDADRLHLFLGEPQVRTALHRAGRADIRIALMHHPFEWLHDSDRDVCEQLLLHGCDFVLRGHLHRTDLTYQQSPGSRAMVIGAGACYKTREHPNAYNLVHLDLDSESGVIYLRVYSNRGRGFWTEDVLSYENVRGKYTFDLFLEPAPAPPPEPLSDMVPPSEAPENLVGVAVAPPVVQWPRPGLDRWWAARGYICNPFMWPNAADVGEDDFPELFRAWHIDPNTDAGLEGLGPTPTLDAISSEENGLVLAYAPAGGGKTFYRRLAARLVEERAGTECVEISDVVAQVSDPDQVTAHDLALCVLDHVSRRLSVELPLSSSASVARILRTCDEVITAARDSQEITRVYVFVDDLHQLFGEESYRARQNTQALKAVLDFCKAAADRGGGGALALRLFIPEGLQESIQRGLGERRRQRIEECTISWSVEHCRSVIERRLDSSWQGETGAGVAHLGRLLTPDALEEFLDWLRRQEGAVSPRCVVRVFDGLARYAYGRSVETSQIDVELWNAFVNSGESKTRCVQAVPYPLEASGDIMQSLAETSTPNQPEYDAFISYSHRDEKWVHSWLLPRLEGGGLRVCVDFRDFEPGAPSITEMERAVRQSRKTLLVLTPNYLASEWTEFENILASTLDPAARRRRIIPLFLEQCKLPLRIRSLTYLDFTGSDQEFQLRRLLRAIRSHLSGGS
jgi:predicted phosphodiesterase